MNMLKHNHYEERRDKPMVLIVDDEYRALLSLSRLISPKEFHPAWAPNAHEGLRLLRKKSDCVRAIIVDLKSSGSDA